MTGTTPDSPSLLARAERSAERLVALRRDLHRHPELGFRETRTAGVAASEVEGAGFEVTQGVAGTGVVADLVSGEGPTVALRADMDALPIPEETGLPWASEVPGVMHACGHDAHTAILVGAAALLAELRDERRLPPGRIRLLFQPSEEAMDETGRSGARRMVEEGVMEDVSAVAGLHVGAHLPPGRIRIVGGPFFAGSDEIRVVVRGRSAHAARPHEGVDALVLAAEGVLSAQQAVSRGLAPWESGIVTFGTIAGGRTMNVIADRVELTGTLRYFDRGVRDRLVEGVRTAFARADAAGGRAEVEIRPGYPPVVNDPDLTLRLRGALAEIVGEHGFLEPEPSMEAEDFAYLAAASRGVFFWLGAGLPDRRRHHHPRFDIDEAVLPLGAALLARSAIELMDATSGR